MKYSENQKVTLAETRESGLIVQHLCPGEYSVKYVCLCVMISIFMYSLRHPLALSLARSHSKSAHIPQIHSNFESSCIPLHHTFPLSSLFLSLVFFLVPSLCLSVSLPPWLCLSLCLSVSLFSRIPGGVKHLRRTWICVCPRSNKWSKRSWKSVLIVTKLESATNRVWQLSYNTH